MSPEYLSSLLEIVNSKILVIPHLMNTACYAGILDLSSDVLRSPENHIFKSKCYSVIDKNN